MLNKARLFGRYFVTVTFAVQVEALALAHSERSPKSWISYLPLLLVLIFHLIRFSVKVAGVREISRLLQLK